jgi:hypothetical protein
MDLPGHEPELIHRLKNLLSISLGFCDLLIDEMPGEDRRRRDLLAIQKAMRDAIELVPELRSRMR